MANRTVVLYVGRERPGLSLFWLDSSGAALDLSGYGGFSVVLEQGGTETALSATVTANSSPTTDTGSAADIPTLSVAFASAALDSITVGPGTLKVIATSGTTDREGQWPVEVRT